MTLNQEFNVTGDLNIISPIENDLIKGSLNFLKADRTKLGSLRLFGFEQSNFRLILDTSGVDNGFSFRTSPYQGTTTEGGQGYPYAMNVGPTYTQINEPTTISPLYSQNGDSNLVNLTVEKTQDTLQPAYSRIMVMQMTNFQPDQLLLCALGTSSTSYRSVWGYRGGKPVITDNYGFIGMTSSSSSSPYENVQLYRGGAVKVPLSLECPCFLSSGTTGMFSNAGDPESVVTGGVGSLCMDTTNGFLYQKRSSVGNTGWTRIDSGSIDVNPVTLDPTNGRVGINQTNPSQALDITGNAYIDGDIITPTVSIQSGTGTPEGVKTANVGSIFMRNDGTTGTTLYTKTSGVGNTGWAPVGGSASLTDVTVNTSLKVVGPEDMGTRLVFPYAASFVIQDSASIPVGSRFGFLAPEGTLTLGYYLDSFNPQFNNSVQAIAFTGQSILLGGLFTRINGTVIANRIAKLSIGGVLDTTFPAETNNTVTAIALQPDGKILIGGDFTTVNGVARNRCARLNADGTLDTTFNPDCQNTILCILVQTDGKIVIGGSFTTVGGVTRNRCARLNTDGTLDNTFDPNCNGVVHTMVQQPSDGAIIIAGDFTTVGVVSRSRCARFTVAGALDTGFSPAFTGIVRSLAMTSSNKIVAGGLFNFTEGNNLARLNADGTVDTTFNYLKPNDNVNAVLVHPVTQEIYVGGNFTAFGGNSRSYFARLASTGNPDFTYTPTPSSSVQKLCLVGNDILVAGPFSNVDLITRIYCAKVLPDSIIKMPSPPTSKTVDKYASGVLEKRDLNKWILTQKNF